MPYSQYREIKTGNEVSAIECGHPGAIIKKEGFDHFETGDYIVRYPQDFFGECKEAIYTKEAFKKTFRSLQTRKQFWAEKGWKI